MAKPSIFSRDYERRMRKRRIRISVVIGIIVVVTAGLVYNLKIKDMDFSNIRNKLQAWVDSDKKVEDNTTAIEEEIKPIEKPIEPEKTYLDVELPDKIKVKCEYIEKDGKKEFVTIEDAKDLTFNISPSKQEILILDKNQNMYLINESGKVDDITKKQYVSRNGSKYPKDERLKMTPKYKWHSDAKFLDDETIVYVSNLPFFGSKAQKEYVWIYNIKTKQDKAIWKSVGKNIVIGESVKDKGIKIKVDNNEYIVNKEGNIVKDGK